jgi:hypothetical protein
VSDMPHAFPPPPAHAHHDPLLVAQVVAGDPLDAARAAEARSWLATCPACTALAADLARVSHAVRSEPVPPRRRDFRLTPEQAERLQGNAVTRLLRRLSLPRSRAFGPAAAAVMSVGLVFVVAGYAWPEGGTVSTGPDAEPAPAVVQEQVAPTAQAVLGAGRSTDTFLAAPEELQATTDEVSELPAPGAAQKASRAEPAAEAQEAAGLAQDTSNVDIVAGEGDTSAADQVDTAAAALTVASSPGADELEAAAPEALAADRGLDDTAVAGAAADTAAADTAAADTAASDTVDTSIAAEQDDGLQRWLIVVGLLLALGGASLLLLAYATRRSADPLLR